MKIKGDTIHFEEHDMPFVSRFGISAATEMVLDFKAVQPLPFLYDIDQLAAFFRRGKKVLFRCAKHPEQEYHTAAIPKNNGGTRQLSVPSRDLRGFQTKIKRQILEQLPVSVYAKAYTKGCTLSANALPHVGKRYLLKLDIAGFFDSITFEQVYTAAFHTGYFPKQIGVLLASLCCLNNTLPQGACTSPALSNLVMRNFDNSMGSWCEKRGISYTRYCDDLSFSSNRPLFHVYQKARSMLQEMGFELNEAKTHFVTNANRQCVTGLTVNEKISVSANYKRKLRQEIYYTLKFGAGEHILRTQAVEFLSGAQPDEKRYLQHLCGKLHFVLQVEPENRWLQSAAKQLEQQLNRLKS